MNQMFSPCNFETELYLVYWIGDDIEQNTHMENARVLLSEAVFLPW